MLLACAEAAVEKISRTAHLGLESPLPKARPGKHGITKLWTPGTPPRKPERPQSLPDSANKPRALLRRDAKSSPKEEDSDTAQATEQPAGNSTAKSQDWPSRETGYLNWLSAYMDEGEASPVPQEAGQVNGSWV